MPKEIPPIFTFPSNTPEKITIDKSRIECPMPVPKNNSFIHSIKPNQYTFLTRCEDTNNKRQLKKNYNISISN